MSRHLLQWKRPRHSEFGSCACGYPSVRGRLPLSSSLLHLSLLSSGVNTYSVLGYCTSCWHTAPCASLLFITTKYRRMGFLQANIYFLLVLGFTVLAGLVSTEVFPPGCLFPCIVTWSPLWTFIPGVFLFLQGHHS